MGKVKHGMAHTKIYRVYCRMKQRCYDQNVKEYKHYGGRGIKVCAEWLDDFMEFYKWATENGYKEGLTIDRKDVNGNYEPNNCMWVDRKAQNNNTRANRYITYNGETHTMAQWAEIKGLKLQTLANRLNIYGWDIERALNEKAVVGKNQKGLQ
jgi:hypothetical protein